VKVKIKMSNEWKRLKKALDRNPAAVRKHLKRASAFIGKKGEALIRREISSGSYAPNAPLTIALKGGKNEPLIGDRTGSPLFKAITSTVVDDYTVFIGVLQQDDQYNIAIAIHEGATIGVSQKMRNLFYVLWMKEKDPTIELEGRARELWDKMSGGWKPLKESTKAIIIPPRPFIANAMNSGELQRMAEKFWNQAMVAAMHEVSQ
jgi:hypothetical protein